MQPGVVSAPRTWENVAARGWGGAAFSLRERPRAHGTWIPRFWNALWLLPAPGLSRQSTAALGQQGPHFRPKDPHQVAPLP
jgi:hypothetical protein